MFAAGLQVFDTLRRREDEHHRNDGHSTESLKRERHSKFILNHGRPSEKLRPSLPLGRNLRFRSVVAPERDFHLPSHIRQDTAQFV